MSRRGQMSLKTSAACGISVMLYTLALHFVGALVVIALTPAIAMLVTLKRGRDVALFSLVTGTLAAFFVQHTLWIASLAGTGFLSVYQGFIWIPMVFAIRYSRNRWRIPLAVSWPIVWCAGEVLRGLGPLGTLFGTLAVPQTTVLWMLQIVDLGGASVAAFPLAALQGWFADICLAWRRVDEPGIHFVRGIWCRPVKIGGVFLLFVWGFVGGYGNVRLSQVERRMEVGPEVGVVATDVLTLPNGEAAYDAGLLLKKLQALSEALIDESPETELIVWPEGMLGSIVPNRAFLETNFEPRMAGVIASRAGLSVSDPSLMTRWNQMRESSGIKENQFQAWIEALGVPVLVGMDTWIPTSVEHEEPFLLQNSAVLFTPDGGQDRKVQSKMRLYPLGEYLPFQDSILGPAIRFFLGEPNAEYSAGSERFQYTVGQDGPRYAVALCSELKFDHLLGLESGSEIETKACDMLVNVANEGLFQRNGMPEIFAFCASLRAIENRVTVVRSSNSGVTGFWSPTGQSYGTVKNAEGQVQSGMGAAELESVSRVIAFREQHKTDLLSNPLRREELLCLIEDVDQIRREAAIEGYSSRRIYHVEERTVFNRCGDHVKLSLIGILFLLNAIEGFSRIRFCKRIAK